MAEFFNPFANEQSVISTDSQTGVSTINSQAPATTNNSGNAGTHMPNKYNTEYNEDPAKRDPLTLMSLTNIEELFSKYNSPTQYPDLTRFLGKNQTNGQASGNTMDGSSNSLEQKETRAIAESMNLHKSTGPYYVGHRPGTFMNPAYMQAFAEEIVNLAARSAGAGNYFNTLQSFVSRLDRHGTALRPNNALNVGFTFITRPRLNLTSGNLMTHPVLGTLYNEYNNSIPFMIRALLDTRLSRGTRLYLGPHYDSAKTLTKEVLGFSADCKTSSIFDVHNPFFVPLCNGLESISGWPDFTLQTEQTEGDFFSGNLEIASGSTMNNEAIELTLQFRDVQGSVIMASFYYWVLYTALQCRGVCMAYPDDIYEQRLNYTVSIYRFITDMTRKNVVGWAKATGCFPKAVPIGQLFNIEGGDTSIAAARSFSIPFVANDVKYNDPGILHDFNSLVCRYEPWLHPQYRESASSGYRLVDLTNPGDNFNALPYIRTTRRDGIELVWYTHDRYNYEGMETKAVSSIEIATKLKQLEDEINKKRAADYDRFLQEWRQIQAQSTSTQNYAYNEPQLV